MRKIIVLSCLFVSFARGDGDSEAPKKDCIFDSLPNVIAHYESNTNETLTPGETVAEFSTIAYRCRPKQVLVGSADNFCDNGKWIHRHPTCTRYCDSLVISEVTNHALCEYSGTGIPCNASLLLPGTRATISCQIGYQKPDRIVQEILVCGDNGEWDYQPFRCEQVCGVEPVISTPFVLGGAKINNTLVPWHVGIYSNLEGQYDQICGGTIINAKVVLSAAHCFWNVRQERVHDKFHYAVAAGKYYRSYNAKEPLPPQFFQVAELNVPIGYKHANLAYINDIAVVVLSDFIVFKQHIKPICVEWQSYNKKSISSNLVGRVAGWGKTGNGIASEELKAVDLPAISYEQCIEKLDPVYKNELTGDKFCVGKIPGEAVCPGDSGGGFTLSRIVGGQKVFFLWGIVSIGLTSGECGGDYYTAFTNVQFHQTMIAHFEMKYRPHNVLPYNPGNTGDRDSGAPNEGCIFDSVPNLIAHYKSEPKEVLRPGKAATKLSTIIYRCQPKHALLGPADNFCDNGKWNNRHPTCTRYCESSVIIEATIQASCEYDGGVIPCNASPLLPGTRATISCQIGYQKPDRTVQEILVCGDNGEWDYQPFRCEQICGVEPVMSTPFILGGTRTNNTLVPWHVGIYSNLEGQYDQICGGTIINAKVVLSAAHCFWNLPEDRLHNESHYVVAAGKYYRSYNAKEPLPTQFFQVAELTVPSGYKDANLGSSYDIAIVVLTNFIVFKQHIKPICIEWQSDDNKSISSNLIGRVAGWGKIDDDTWSEELEAVDLPSVSYEECIEKIPELNKNDLRPEKFCVGKIPGELVCQADSGGASGGGFAVPKIVNGRKLFFLWGIFINALNNGGECAGKYYTAFANIQFYQKTIVYYEVQNRPR